MTIKRQQIKEYKGEDRNRERERKDKKNMFYYLKVFWGCLTQ